MTESPDASFLVLLAPFRGQKCVGFGIAPTCVPGTLDRLMGRQWLHAKRAIVNLKKGQTVGKLVKEITVAAKLGGADLAANARLFAVVEKAKKASVTRDVIERAIAKGSGTPNKEKIGKVTEKQVREIATQKMPDLNAASVETAIKSIKGPPGRWALKWSLKPRFSPIHKALPIQGGPCCVWG